MQQETMIYEFLLDLLLIAYHLVQPNESVNNFLIGRGNQYAEIDSCCSLKTFIFT
jgi:hypothetical protein